MEDLPEFQPPDGPDADPGFNTSNLGQEEGGDNPAMMDAELSPAELQRQEIIRRSDERRTEQAALEASCRQAQEQLAEIEPSRRVFYEDENGETTRLDDDQRMKAIEELQKFLTANCR